MGIRFAPHRSQHVHARPKRQPFVEANDPTLSSRGGLVTAVLEAAIEAPGVDRPPSPIALLFAPDRGMERQARVGRARWFFLFAWVCALLLATALALRVDAKSS